MEVVIWECCCVAFSLMEALNRIVHNLIYIFIYIHIYITLNLICL